MADSEWSMVRDKIVEAIQSHGIADDFRDGVNYHQLCFSIMHAMDDAKRSENATGLDIEMHEAFNRKSEIAQTVLREHDLLFLRPGEPDGAPEYEYDWEASLVGTCVPSGASVELAAQAISYVLSRSFNVDYIGARECSDAAREMLSQFPYDYTNPDDFDFEDLKELFDEMFDDMEKLAPGFVEAVKTYEKETGEYVDLGIITIHFIANVASDMAMMRGFEI
jgi:hypothetical protein